MAGNSIKVNTEQVTAIAAKLDGLNKQLSEELRTAKTTLDNLKNVWQGDAATETTSAFDSFVEKYLRQYEDVIDQYVQFLRKCVSEGYFNTETVNTKLAEAFK